jgi:hypothetical protein
MILVYCYTSGQSRRGGEEAARMEVPSTSGSCGKAMRGARTARRLENPLSSAGDHLAGLRDTEVYFAALSQRRRPHVRSGGFQGRPSPIQACCGTEQWRSIWQNCF